MPILQVASSNSGKIAEFHLAAQLWLGNDHDSGPAAQHRADGTSRWTIQLVPGIDALPPCREDGDSFAANARKKALHYSGIVGGLVLGDDSGLEVEALGGAPGIYSRRYAGENASDDQNNAKLLQQLTGIPSEQRTAQFVCALAVAQGREVAAEFRGVARGMILASPRGTDGFGYDPLFLDPESERTFAEMAPEDKLRRSHRGQALRMLLEWLEQWADANHKS